MGRSRFKGCIDPIMAPVTLRTLTTILLWNSALNRETYASGECGSCIAMFSTETGTFLVRLTSAPSLCGPANYEGFTGPVKEQ
ncbi:hypothetical protein XAC3608_370003 [Xanthomonas citri pv. citri]|nr:hypothetical protein XAC3608_370003 [Xanthomonas citri pv. citri]CEH83317.1 hypothetical protein XACB302_10690003 [Xanthomonas citri pv. citri]CEI11557.1 hypothetical protein XACG115_2600003 [Xanthomonas citri pv. citri]